MITDYRMICARLIPFIKWKNDCFLFEKKGRKKMSIKTRHRVLDELCEKIVDVICETFAKKHYCVRCSQFKN